MSNKPLFRVIVAGGRDFDNYDLLCTKLDKILSKVSQTHEIHIVCGMARGADSLGAEYAKARGYAVDSYPAEWNRYGKRAGYLRNATMANNADALVAFWDTQSKGTSHMITLAREKQLKVRVILYDHYTHNEARLHDD